LIDFYTGLGTLVRVSAKGAPEDILARTLACLEARRAADERFVGTVQS
jgi:hypothetical protein